MNKFDDNISEKLALLISVFAFERNINVHPGRTGCFRVGRNIYRVLIKYNNKPVKQ